MCIQSALAFLCSSNTQEKVASFGPVSNYSLVHKHKTLKKGKYAHKKNILCTSKLFKTLKESNTGEDI
jgi:hypothetical protein